MKRDTLLFMALTMVLLALVAGSARSAIFPQDEQTAVVLNGIDPRLPAISNFTQFVRKTGTPSQETVFSLTLNVFTNFDYDSCEFAFGPRFSFPEECERDLWLAVMLPDTRIFFLEFLGGGNIGLQDAGDQSFLPFLPDVRPYVHIGDNDPNNPFQATPTNNRVPYAGGYNLLDVTQNAVNSLPEGKYTFFAGFSTHLLSADDLVELLLKKVSNLSQFEVFIAPLADSCSTVQQAGTDTPDTRVIEMGKTAGTFRFDFETFTQEDRIIVRYPPGCKDCELFNTGCVGASGTVFRSYSGSSTQVEVEVIPNCAGGSGTAWNYTVHCPL